MRNFFGCQGNTKFAFVVPNRKRGDESRRQTNGFEMYEMTFFVIEQINGTHLCIGKLHQWFEYIFEK